MDKNEIVRKYKWFRVLRVILRGINVVLLVVIFLITLLFIPFFIIPFFVYCDDNVVTFEILYFLKKLDNFFNLLDRFTHHFEKKWGMTEKEIKEFISKQEEQEALRRKEQEEQKALRRKKREILGWNPVKYAFPFIREICKLNKGAKEAQEAILSDFLSKKEVEIIFDDFRKLGSLEDAILCWRERSLPERLSFMRFLFKLAILQDGIHNDEWNMLMHLIWQLRFSNYYREDFIYRYFSLRTEFYDYERKSSSSTEDNSASTNNRSSSLKPYFTILGLEETASDEEIKRAYHKLALQHHPDMQKNADRIKECEAMMAKINEAYEKLRGW